MQHDRGFGPCFFALYLPARQIEESAMFTCTQAADHLRIHFSGRLDTAQSSTLQSALLAQVSASSLPVVFDLAEVNFIASSFLRLCIMSAQKLGNGRLSLEHVSPSIHKVFAMAGLDQFIPMR